MGASGDSPFLVGVPCHVLGAQYGPETEFDCSAAVGGNIHHVGT